MGVVFLISWLGLATHVDAAPEIRVSASAVDLGDMSPGEVRERVLTVENTGDHALTISQIESSCALCTSGTLASQAVAPHSSTRLLVTYKAGQAGTGREPQQAILTLRSNDPNRPAVEIRVIARVIPPATKAQEKMPEVVRQALRGRCLSIEEWAAGLHALPAQPNSTDPALSELVSSWHSGPRFRPVPKDGAIPERSPNGNGIRDETESPGVEMIQKTLAARIASGTPRLARLLARDFPHVGQAAVDTLKNLPADAPFETRCSAVLLLAELAFSEGQYAEAAGYYRQLVDDGRFPESLLAVDGQYPPYASDPGRHAARRIWRLAQIYWLLGDSENCLAVARKGMAQFHGVRWIRWADLLLPLAAQWKAEGKEAKAKEVYALAMDSIPASHERTAAVQPYQAMERAEQQTEAIRAAREALEDPLRGFK